jgi:hypothetical protein
MVKGYALPLLERELGKVISSSESSNKASLFIKKPEFLEERVTVF